MRREARRAPRQGRAAGPAPPRNEGRPARRPHGCELRAREHNMAMTAAELQHLAEELGLDGVGATPAAAYEETEPHSADRRARGLFADMRFTMAQPETSCHP